MVTATKQTTKAGAQPATLSATVSLGELPLLVESMQATNVETKKLADGKAETVPAYEVTLKAVIPENLMIALAAAIREHRIVVRVQDPEGVGT